MGRGSYQTELKFRAHRTKRLADMTAYGELIRAHGPEEMLTGKKEATYAQKIHLAHCRIWIVTLIKVTFLRSNRPKAGRRSRLRICDGAHIATRPPEEQEDRLTPGPPGLSGATFDVATREEWRTLSSQPCKTPAERRVCVVLLLAAFL